MGLCVHLPHNVRGFMEKGEGAWRAGERKKIWGGGGGLGGRAAGMGGVKGWM